MKGRKNPQVEKDKTKALNQIKKEDHKQRDANRKISNKKKEEEMIYKNLNNKKKSLKGYHNCTFCGNDLGGQITNPNESGKDLHSGKNKLGKINSFYGSDWPLNNEEFVDNNSKRGNSSKKNIKKEKNNRLMNKQIFTDEIKLEPPEKKGINQPIGVIFNFDQTETIIQTNLEEKMENIIEKYFEKSEISKEDKFFLYNGLNIDKKLLLSEIINDIDKKRKKLIILVKDYSQPKQPEEIVSKNFICPECYENVLLTLDNYKIGYVCKNHHYKNQININEYKTIQTMNLTKIICGQCKEKTKYMTHNNEFYFCQTCQMNLCPLCKGVHNQNEKHKIVNYDDKNYICEKHNEKFIEFCEECNQNLCFFCQNDHQLHKGLINFQKIMIGKEKAIKEFDDTKALIDKIKKIINDIQYKLNNFIENINTLYTINRQCIENYEASERNYQVLQNMKEITEFNSKLYTELKCLKDEKTFSNKISQMIDIYNRMNADTYEIIYPNGDKYIGEMSNNLRNGKGKMIYNQDKNKRNYYEGDWKDDLYDGKGVLYLISSDVYKGDFKKGVKEGKGTFYYIIGDSYEGEWKNDKKEGKGIYTYENGNKYEGEMKNDLMEGKGIFYWINGDKFIGEFKNCNADGKGVYFHNNGEIEMGIFSNRQKIGKFALLNLNNKIEIKKY